MRNVEARKRACRLMEASRTSGLNDLQYEKIEEKYCYHQENVLSYCLWGNSLKEETKSKPQPRRIKSRASDDRNWGFHVVLPKAKGHVRRHRLKRAYCSVLSYLNRPLVRR